MLDPELPRYPSIVHALRASASRYAERAALVCEGRRLSYAELARMVLGLSERLTRLGVAGEPVVVLAPTSIEAIVAVLAVLCAGARVAPVNPFFTVPELNVVLREVDARVVICSPDASRKVGPLAAVWRIDTLLTLGGGGADALDLRAWAHGQGLDWTQAAEPLPEHPAVLIFTGGTTGEPKAVEHSHRSLMVSVLQHCSVWRVALGAERFLSAAPIFHIWGLFYATFVPLYAGGTLVIVPKFDPEAVLSAIGSEQISVFGGGPAPAYMSLLQSPSFGATDFSSLKYCLSGGAACPEELQREWARRTGCALLEGWGMSEAAPLCLSSPAAHKLLSVGQAVPETEVEVVDVETGSRVLEAGEAGEVRVRGPQLMLGYRGRLDATREILRDGWLYTGDIGYLDREAHLFLIDRKKDMIIVGGYNVYPRQVDEVLFRHPEVAEAACVGRPDARLGEVLVAFVVLEPGARLDAAGFFEYCRGELVKYRRPVSVTFVSSLPRTNARKLDKKALRALAASST